MSKEFYPEAAPMLIGSQPLKDHDAALELVFKYVGEIPNWVQLPAYPIEGMLPQFAAGLPGLVHTKNKLYVDTSSDHYEADVLNFFESYLAVSEPPHAVDAASFGFAAGTADGFYKLTAGLSAGAVTPRAVKGQVTGPITFCTAVKDQEDRAIFYDDGLRDAAVKLLAVKAAWQVGQLSQFNVPVIMFIDEPALAGYGSSELISISQEQISQCLDEVIDAVHQYGGLAGVHVCANTDWSLLLNSKVDIINFDAFGYFDKFILYGSQIKSFLDSGRFLAWGLVPTGRSEDVEHTDIDQLFQLWQDQKNQVVSLGVDPETLVRQSFITPSCGTGSLIEKLSLKVLRLTRELSERIRHPK